jgi:hypothetical protein
VAPHDPTTLLSFLGDLLMPTSTSQIPVTKFHHTLLWPLLLRGHEEDPHKIDPFLQALRAAGWEEFELGTTGVAADFTYEEIVYFHPFVRDFLFGDGYTKTENRLLRRMKYPKLTGVKVGLPDGTNLDLRVERAELRLIRPRVLLVILEISNRRGDTEERTPLTLEQVLVLQSNFRRAYPPYFLGEKQGDTLRSFEWVGLTTPSGTRTLAAGRQPFEVFLREGAEPPVYDHWQALFGSALQPMRSLANRRGDAGLYYQQIVDERIPGMSYLAVSDPNLIDEEVLDRLPAFDPPDLSYDPDFLAAGRAAFRYTRFAHTGTTYYCNGTSFTLLTRNDAPPFLLDHFRRHYAHLGVIAHYQHSALLYFLDAFAEASRDLVGHSTSVEFRDPAWRKKVRLLLHRFLKFRSRSYFTEVSNQIQGKELFDLWTEQLGTPALFERVADLSAQFYEVLEDKETRELTVAAEVGLGISIFLAAFAAVGQISALVPRSQEVGWETFGWATGVGLGFSVLWFGGFRLWSWLRNRQTS